MAGTYVRYRQIRIADNQGDQATPAQITGALTNSVTQEDLQYYFLSRLNQVIFGAAYPSHHWYEDFLGEGILSLKDLSASIAPGKPWSHQMAATGRSANIVPTTFAQANQLAAGAAPTTTSPTSTTCAYSTLGGEYVLDATASSENLLGVFGYQVPAPYTLHVTDILLPQPFITTALGATVNIQEWCLMVASSNDPATATGQRYTLGMFSAAASAVAGTVMNGLPLDFDLGTPIVVPPGQYLLVLVKMISGSATGVYRGSVFVNGYYE